MKPIAIGICAAFFFAFTFVLNASMEASGGHWIWSASLRYLFMVPFLLAIVAFRKNLKGLIVEMKKTRWLGCYGALLVSACFMHRSATLQLILLTGS